MLRIKTCLLTIFILFSISIFSQKEIVQKEIWGYNTLAGSEGGGLIFKVDPENKETEPIHRFGHGLKHESRPSEGKLWKHSNGLFYGVSEYIDEYSNGSPELFSFNPENDELIYLTGLNGNSKIVALYDDKIITLLTPNYSYYIEFYAFDVETNTNEKVLRIDTSNPFDIQGYLLQYNDSIFYASTKLGGTYNYGAILEIDLKNNTFNSIVNFSEDKYPIGGLLKHSNNKIYGTVHRTSEKGFGGIFEFDPIEESYQIIVPFNDETGGYPQGEIFEANDGNIYGVTSLRGAYNDGCIYRFKPTDNSIEGIYDIDDESDLFVNHEILGGFAQFPNNQKLYGILRHDVNKFASFGKLFSFNTETNNFEIIYSFNSGFSEPVGSLTYDNNELMGLVQLDTNGSGGIFALSGENMETNFKKSLYASEYVEDGQNPVFLFQAKDQNIYGMTAYGGKDNKGVVFMIDNITYKYAKLMDLADFNHNIDPYAEGFEIEPGKIIGISGPQYWSFNGMNVKSGLYIFEYDYINNKLEQKQSFSSSSSTYLYGPRLNSRGEMYFSLGGLLWEYDYINDTIYKSSIGVPAMRDIVEYEDNLYFGSFIGIEPDYNIIFKWDRNTNEISEMLSKLDISTNPNRISPYGKIYISDDILYGSLSSSTSGGAGVGSYQYDVQQDSFNYYNPFGGDFDGHLRRSMIETQDKEYFIINRTYRSETIGNIEIYQKDQDTTYQLYLEEPNVDFSYTLEYGWESNPDFDFTLRVDLIDVTPPRDLIYWTGTADTNWYNEENWFLNKTPDGVTGIVILPNRDHYPVIDSSLNTAHLEIQKGAEITLLPTASLTSSSIQNIGTINMLSNKDAKASLLTTGDFENIGEVIYTYLGEKDEQVVLGSPVRGEMGNQFLISEFDGQEWVSIEDSLVELSAFQALKFTLDSTQKIDFRGDCHWGDLVYTSEFSGFYPLANPYPSSLDWQKTDVSSLNQQALYKIDHQDSSISAYINGIGDASPLIEPTETFWLHFSNADQISLFNSDRLHAEDFEEIASPNELQISVDNGSKTDIACISFNQNAHYQFHAAEDAAYPDFESFEQPQISTYAGDQKLLINQLPDTAMMDMSVLNNKDGQLTIKLQKNKDFDFVVLEDLIWNKRIDLLEEDYTFDYFVSDGDYPFKLYFEPWALEPINESDIDMYYYLETLIIRSRKQVEYADVYIYDLAGKLSLDFKMENSFYFEKDINLPGGHYIAQFISGDLVINKKVFVR